MGLINLTTNLKSLKFGHDRPGGGSSNQPYIAGNLNPGINDNLQNLNSPDFLLRGGILAPVNSVVDAIRLGKYFTDFKSPSGLFFILKQELLSRVAVRTQASGKLLNEGIYNPLSTLAQAGVNAFGLHLNKQGLNPFPGSVGSIRTYSEAVANEEGGAIDVIRNFTTGLVENLVGINLRPNRLVELTKVKITGESEGYSQNGIVSLKNDNVDLMTYSGGPGSILGIGNTHIRLIDGKQRTGINNIYSKGSPDYLSGLINSYTQRKIKSKLPLGASTMYDTYYKGNIFAEDNVLVGYYKSNPLDSKSSANSHFGIDYKIENPKESLQLNKEEIAEAFGNTYRYTAVVTDFRKVIKERIKNNKTLTEKAKTVLSNAPDYNSGKAIESRVFLGDPGGKNRDLTSYTSGYNGSGSSSSNSYDRITALPLYRSNAVDTTKPINDLVKFRIAAIDNDDPEQKVFIHFRAFLGSISDNFNSDTNSIRYPGRGEEFFNYEGFSRKILLSFTVAAQSKAELIPMYHKLNYLASQVAPDYSRNGYMRGPLVQLTIGGYLYEQVGIINNLTLDITEETPWEIGINDTGEYDNTVKELPHMIKVSGFSFTPIHSFIPKKAKWDELGKTPFIALTNGANNNY